jgi:hypothetical protein
MAGKMIVLNEGGAGEQKVIVENIRVPDLFHIAAFLAMAAKGGGGIPVAASGEEMTRDLRADSEAILETWHLCHDLLKELRNA